MPNFKIILDGLQNFVLALESKKLSKLAEKPKVAIAELKQYLAAEENAMRDEKSAVQPQAQLVTRHQAYRLLINCVINYLRTANSVLDLKDQRDLHKQYANVLFALCQAKYGLKEYELTVDASLSLQEIQVLKPYLVQLQKLIMSRCQIGDEGAIQIADVLADSKCEIRVLELAENGITSVGALRLFQQVRGNARSKLRELSFNANPITDTAVEDLAAGLAESSIKLKLLYLANCGIKTKGAMALAECLKSNKTVEGLDVSSNKDISAKDYEMLFDAVIFSKQLRMFAMHRAEAKEDDEVAKLVIGKLPQLEKENFTLIEFHSGIRFDNNTSKMLEKMFLRNRRLKMESDAMSAAAYAAIAFERANSNHALKTSFIEPKKSARSLIGLVLSYADLHPIRKLGNAPLEDKESWGKTKTQVQRFRGTKYFQTVTRPHLQAINAIAASAAPLAKIARSIKRKEIEPTQVTQTSQASQASQASQPVAMERLTQSPTPWDEHMQSQSLSRQYSIPSPSCG
jgi:hypothetical protein